MNDESTTSPQTSPTTTTAKMTTQGTAAGFRPHEARHMGNIGENDRERGNSQLLRVFDFRHF